MGIIQICFFVVQSLCGRHLSGHLSLSNVGSLASLATEREVALLKDGVVKFVVEK